MKILHNTKFLLIMVVVLAAVLRLWQLGNVPLSPDWDEASLGYNAYAILNTGKDEYGTAYPVVLKSFGDYKPALYTYLIIPFLPFFDLSLQAVRLPSAIMGIIAVVGLYFLVKELLPDKRIALLSSFLLAISPWHIQFSRVAFEANIGLTCIILFALFFIKAMKDGKFLILSSVFAALGLYTYQSEKVFLPLLLLAFLVIYRREILRIHKKFLLSSVVLGLIISLPLLLFMFSHPESLARAKMTSIVSRGDSILERSAKRLEKDRERGDILGQLFNDRRIVYGKAIVNGYVVHLDPNWLFITGDMPRHHVPGMGLLYIWELPFIITGFIVLLFLKNKKSTAVILSWLLLAPIPAALTYDVPHAVRTIQMLPMLQILSAMGIITGYEFVKKREWKSLLRYGVIGIFLIAVLITFLYYLNQYFVQQNYFYAKDWQYGYKEAIEEVEKNKGRYDDIIVASTVPMDQSYIFFLYYLKYPPDVYQKEGIYYNGQVDHAFGNYQFRPINWADDKSKKNTLFVGSSEDFSGNNTVLKTVLYPDGKDAIMLVAP